MPMKSSCCRMSKVLLVSTVSLVLASKLVSADSRVLEDYPPEFSSGHMQLEADGVRIGIKALDSKNTIREYFGKYIEKQKVTPIHVVIENGSARNLIYDYGDFVSTLEGDIATDSDSQERLKQSEVSGAKLMRGFYFIPAAMLFGHSRGSKAGRTLHAVSKRALRSQTIRPGEQISGFVYPSSESLRRVDAIEYSSLRLAEIDRVVAPAARSSVQLMIPDDICILTEDESPWIDKVRAAFGEGLCNAIHDAIRESGLAIDKTGADLVLTVEQSEVTMASWGTKKREIFVAIEWSLTTSDGELIWAKPATAAIAKAPAKTIVSEDFAPLFSLLIQDSVSQLQGAP